MSDDLPVLHVLGLPHTETTHEFSWCAFTQLNMNFCTMMHRLGYDVVLYDGETTDAEVTELVTCKLDPVEKQLYIPEWTPAYFHQLVSRQIKEAKQRIQPRDIICLSQGSAQREFSQAFPEILQVDHIAGYPGVWARHVVWPSNAWRSIGTYNLMLQGGPNCVMARPADTVIPHFLDPNIWHFGLLGYADYLLFVGRLNMDKGLGWAFQIAGETGLPLKVIGASHPGVPTPEWPEGVEYIGAGDASFIAHHMQRARATLTLSLFMEPFNLVAAEAQMCGCPVVATDWGAFPETVIQGKTGWRVSSVAEAVHYLQQPNPAIWSRRSIAKSARDRFSMENLGPEYDAYFRRILQEI